MQKRISVDSGSFEAQAVLGEDLFEGLASVLFAVQIPIPREWAGLREHSPAVTLCVALFGIEALCLVYAYQTSNLAFAVTLLTLMAAQSMTLVRLAMRDPDIVFVQDPLVQQCTCKVCGEVFTVDAGYQPGEKSGLGVPPDLRSELMVCSSRCAVRK